MIAAGSLTDDDRQKMLDTGLEKIGVILSLGLAPCMRAGDGMLRSILLSPNAVPITQELAAEVCRASNGSLGTYISDTGYYDPARNSTTVPTELAGLEVGEYGRWVFAVYDPNAKGYRENMQAMFTGYNWQDQKKLYDEFAAKYAGAGTIMCLDHASQGLFHAYDAWLHTTGESGSSWKENALGRIGVNRFINLPTQVQIDGKEKQLFPGGDADADGALECGRLVSRVRRPRRCCSGGVEVLGLVLLSLLYSLIQPSVKIKS